MLAPTLEKGFGRPQGAPLRDIPLDFGTGDPSPMGRIENFRLSIFNFQPLFWDVHKNVEFCLKTRYSPFKTPF